MPPSTNSKIMKNSYYSINDAQTLPKVSEEARSFINSLPENFALLQKKALEDAMAGDLENLDKIRLGRIVPISDRSDVFHIITKVNFGGEERKLYIFIPKEIGKDLRVVVYYHGGGWCINAPESCSMFCQDIAAKTKSVVVCPEYRLAPENKYPAANLDAVSTVEWVKKNISNSSGLKIFLAGDSAGGHLAASTALHFKDSVDGVIMFYPALDLSLGRRRKSWGDFAKGHCLDADLMETFIKAYLPNEAASQNEDTSPLLARDLKGFPNSLIISAQCDILRDEALEFASRLAEFGINVRYRCIEGATHLFITKPEMKEAYCNALSEASEFVLKNSE